VLLVGYLCKLGHPQGGLEPYQLFVWWNGVPALVLLLMGDVMVTPLWGSQAQICRLELAAASFSSSMLLEASGHLLPYRFHGVSGLMGDGGSCC